MPESDFLFVFFPYIKTTTAFRFHNLIVRSSEDKSDLPEKAIRHFENLCSMFFLRDHLQIEKMLYVFHVFSQDDPDNLKFIELIKEFQALTSYFYSLPDPTTGDLFMGSENFDFYVCQPQQVTPLLLVPDHNVKVLSEGKDLLSKTGFIDGYLIKLNNESYFFTTLGSRIFPSRVLKKSL